MLKLIVFTVIVVYVLSGLMLYIFQRSFIYFPVGYASANGLTDISITSNGYLLKGFVANRNKPKALIYFGGNAEQIALSLSELSKRFPEITIMGFYYRGYGGSEGEPSEDNLYQDSLTIFDQVYAEYSSVFVMGRSLGTGVATYLAQNRDVQKLILITPFDSLLNIAQQLHWYFPVKYLLRDAYNSAGRAHKISCPVLILAAENDEVIQAQNTRNLIQHFQQQQVISRFFSHVGHNTIENAPGYYSNLHQFLNN